MNPVIPIPTIPQTNEAHLLIYFSQVNNHTATITAATAMIIVFLAYFAIY